MMVESETVVLPANRARRHVSPNGDDWAAIEHCPQNHNLADISFENELSEKIKQHNKAAIREFVDIYLPQVLSFLLSFGINRSDADEIAVSTISDSILKIDRFSSRGKNSLRNWIFTIAYHLMCDWSEEKKLFFPEASIGNAVNYQTWQKMKTSVKRHSPEQQALDKAFVELDEREQICVYRRMLHVPYPFKEIGAEIGVTEGNARVIFNRALAKLRKQVKIGKRDRETI
jgi:RNA polymerase sigma factor (sigma-70 family)